MTFASLACTFTWLPWHQTNLKLNTRAFNVVLRSTHMSTQNTNIPRMWTDSGKTHPRRPRGSQSGQEKRQDESFHYRRKGPRVPTLTEPFPKIQADAGSRLGTKNALYYFAQSANTSQMSSFHVFVHDGYCFDHGLSSLCTKEMHAVRKLSVWYKSPIWSNALTLIVKCKRTLLELNFYQPYPSCLLLVYVLHKTWNWAFSRVVMQLTAKKKYKKACKVVVLPCQAVSYLTFSSLPNLNCDPLKTEYSRGKFNIIALADSNPNVFSTHR